MLDSTTIERAIALFRATPTTSLAVTAETILRERFDGFQHNPSAQQWDAIRDLLAHLELASEHRLEPAAYLSAIPCGVGKSQSIAAFCTALVQSNCYLDTGVLIAVNRLEEVREMCDPEKGALADILYAVHVIVGKGEDNDAYRTLGHYQGDPNYAQIIVTTQAALRETLRYRPDFNQAERYYYQGERRAIVCWDEALCWQRGVAIKESQILTLAHNVRDQSYEAYAALVQWSAQLLTINDRSVIDVPDLAALGVNFSTLEADTQGDAEMHQRARLLSVISGERVTVIPCGGKFGGALVQHIPELPPSLQPLVVTDASAAEGVAHEAYRQMENDIRVTMTHLKPAEKSYRNLAIRLVDVACSRSVFDPRQGEDQSKADKIIERAVAWVQSIPDDEPKLVITYAKKKRQRRDILKSISRHLNAAQKETTSFLTWGSHKATNVHEKTQHLLLCGLNYLPKEAAYAASSAAQNLQMLSTETQPSDVDVKAMRIAMLRDDTFQGILRIHARKSVGGDCGPATVTVFQSKLVGLKEDDYRGMFPQCHVAYVDKPKTTDGKLTGNLKRMADYVQGRLKAGDTEISNPSIYGALRIDRQDFSKLVKKPAWQAFVQTQGLQPRPLKGRLMGLVKVV